MKFYQSHGYTARGESINDLQEKYIGLKERIREL